MIKLAAQVVPLKLDAEKDGKKLAQKYGVTGYPAIVFVTASGEEVGRIAGYLPPEQYATTMLEINKSHKEFPKLQQRVKENPGDGEASTKLAAILVKRGRIDEAAKVVQDAEKAGLTGNALAKVLNELGDGYYHVKKFDIAISVYKRAEQAATEDHEKAFALYSLMAAHYYKDEVDRAKAYAKRVIDLEGASDEFKKSAKALLDR